MKEKTKFKQTEIGMIPKDWDVKDYGSVSIVRRGASPRPIHDFLSTGGIPWVKISDATAQNTRFIEWTEQYIKEEGRNNTVIVKPGDLIVSNSATPGLPKFLKINAGIHDGWLLIVPKKGYNKHFIYYSFIFERSKLVGIADGSVFKNLKTDIVRNHKIGVPEEIEQSAIAKILSDLDSKIELNQQMNESLEEISRAIFKRWFIDFEFPNEKGKPYKSSGGEMVDSEIGDVPKGWIFGEFADILTEIESGSRPKGGIDSNETEIPSIGAENIDGIADHDYSKEKFISRKFFEKMRQGIVKNNDVLLYKDGAKIGRISFFDYDYPHKECAINEHVFILRSNNKINQEFLYLWLDRPNMTQSIINLNSNAAQPGINQPQVKSLPILIPNKELLNQFQTTVKIIFHKLFENAKHNQNLSQIRDSLLPRLMSGKIRVPVEVRA